MRVTIAKLYDDHEAAASVVRQLEAVGVREVSLMAGNAGGRYTQPSGPVRDSDIGEGVATGVGIGAATGGLAGLLTGLGVLAVPGIGPVVAAGWLASAAAGAAAGGAAGGMIGALTASGTSEDDAHLFAEAVRRGGVLVAARVDEADRLRTEAVMENGAVNLAARREAYLRSGWSRFDERAAPSGVTETRERRNTPNLGGLVGSEVNTVPNVPAGTTTTVLPTT